MKKRRKRTSYKRHLAKKRNKRLKWAAFVLLSGGVVASGVYLFVRSFGETAVVAPGPINPPDISLGGGD